jgi:hypothetical protein
LTPTDGGGTKQKVQFQELQRADERYPVIILTKEIFSDNDFLIFFNTREIKSAKRNVLLFQTLSIIVIHLPNCFF